MNKRLKKKREKKRFLDLGFTQKDWEFNYKYPRLFIYKNQLSKQFLDKIYHEKFFCDVKTFEIIIRSIIIYFNDEDIHSVIDNIPLLYQTKQLPVRTNYYINKYYKNESQ